MINLTTGNTQKIIDSWDGDLRQLAYMLATAYHETGGKMIPVREKYSKNPDEYFHRMYDPESPDPDRAKLAKKMGALHGDGVIFYGRGYPQITWRPNYLKFEKILKQDLTSSAKAADKLLDHDTALFVMAYGMQNGSFTGKKLSDYINDTKTDYVGARRIINGTDCAQKIADLAAEYYRLLG